MHNALCYVYSAEVLRTMSEECDAILKQMGQLASGSTGTQGLSRSSI